MVVTLPFHFDYDISNLLPKSCPVFLACVSQTFIFCCSFKIPSKLSVDYPQQS